MLSGSTRWVWMAPLWVLTVAGCSRLTQPSPSGAQLPATDQRVQGWISQMAPQHDPPLQAGTPRYDAAVRHMSAAKADIHRAREQGQLSDTTWLLQVLRLVSSLEGTHAWGMMLHLMQFSMVDLKIESLSAIHTLEPFLDSTDPRVAQRASAMLDAALDYAPAGPGDPSRKDKFLVFEEYLRSRDPSALSWKMVGKIYSADPDRAVRVIATVYLDAESQRKLEHDQRELKRLIFEYDRTTGDEQKQWGTQIEAKLGELSRNSHWCVRAYALTILSRNRRAAPRQGPHWARDSAIPSQLVKDPHPFVQTCALSSTGYYHMPDPKMRALFGGEVKSP